MYKNMSVLIFLIVFSLLSSSFLEVEAKEQSFAKLKERADFLFFHGDFVKAKDLYEEALEINPRADDVRMTLLNLLLKQEDNAKAIILLEALIETKPKDSILRLILANLYKKEKKADKAVLLLEESVKLFPKAGSMHGALGFNYLDQGRTDEARREFDIAKKDFNSYQDAQIGLAIISFKSKDLVQAGNILDELAGREKKLSSVVHELRGHLKTAEGKEDEAIEHFDKAVKAQSKSAALHSTVGNLHFKNQRFEEAEKSFRKAIKLEEKASENYYALAVVLNKQGKKEEAASYFKLGAARDKDPARAKQMENLSLILSGNSKETFVKESFPVLEKNSAESIFGASYDRVLQEMLLTPHK